MFSIKNKIATFQREVNDLLLERENACERAHTVISKHAKIVSALVLYTRLKTYI